MSGSTVQEQLASQSEVNNEYLVGPHGIQGDAAAVAMPKGSDGLPIMA